MSPKRRRIDSASAVKMTGFINYGPKKVQGGDQLTLHVYCIDPHDSAFNNVVPHVEKDKDYTLWGHPKCCNVPGGEHIDISVQQTSDILTIDDDEKDKQFDANWSGFTSVEFQFHVGEPEESCKAKVFLNVSCGGSHLTDIKMTSNVNPACERGMSLSCVCTNHSDMYDMYTDIEMYGAAGIYYYYELSCLHSVPCWCNRPNMIEVGIVIPKCMAHSFLLSSFLHVISHPSLSCFNCILYD